MQDVWRAYLELALGLTRASRDRAGRAARGALERGGATAVQLRSAAEQLLAAGDGNREALTRLVRYEIDRALGAVGLASADEVAELTSRVRRLERRLAQLSGDTGEVDRSGPRQRPDSHESFTGSDRTRSDTTKTDE